MASPPPLLAHPATLLELIANLARTSATITGAIRQPANTLTGLSTATPDPPFSYLQSAGVCLKARGPHRGRLPVSALRGNVRRCITLLHVSSSSGGQLISTGPESRWFASGTAWAAAGRGLEVLPVWEH
jgi:hypothetical protein